jgi:WD40 repeat protein
MKSHLHGAVMRGILLTLFLAAGVVSWPQGNPGRVFGAECRELVGHTASISALAFSPDSRTLASGSADTTLRLWDVVSGKLQRTIVTRFATAPASPFDAMFRQAAAMSQRDAEDEEGPAKAKPSLARRKDQPLPDYFGQVSALAWSPDGRLVAGVLLGNGGQELDVYHARSGKVQTSLNLWNQSLAMAEVIRRQKTAAMRGVAGGAGFHLTSGSESRALGFSADGRLVAGGTLAGTVKIWEVSGKPLLVLEGLRAGAASLAFLPPTTGARASARHSLITADGVGTISIWSGEGRLVRQWETPPKAPAQLLAEHDSLACAAWSSDGKLAATAKGKPPRIALWDIATGQALVTLLPPTQPPPTEPPIPDRVGSMAFSPDGKFLAAQMQFGRAYLWETDTGRLRVALEKGIGAYGPVAISADGRTLARAAVFSQRDERILLYDLSALLADGEKQPAPPEFRTWTSADGRFTVEAQFIKRTGDALTVQKKDGRQIQVPVAELSPADQEYLRRPKAEPSGKQG